MERTLSIIKPDAVEQGYTGAILEKIEGAGLKLLGLRMLCLSQKDAEAFYAVHAERPFYKSLVEFMTSGPVVVSALEGENAIARYRELMGATDPADAAEGTIRKDLAENVEVNTVHGSDGPATAKEEIAFFFSAWELIGGERI